MPSDIEIREDDAGRGAIVSFPFDAAFAERFRSAFPRARWSDQYQAWRVPGATAVRRAALWLDRELPSTFGRADERGRDSFSFEPIVSPYLTVTDELVIRTPYSRTVVGELRAVPWAGWKSQDKAWRVPFRSVDELRNRWPAIEAAAKRNEPEARRQRHDAAKSAPDYMDTRTAARERRRRRYPVPASALPPPDKVLMSHAGPLVIIAVTGEVVPGVTAEQHYAWSLARQDLVWALWRRPTLDELVETWPARHPPTASELLRGWWQPTLGELRPARRAARSLERARETRREHASSQGGTS